MASVNTAEILHRLDRYVHHELHGEGTGHDYWHVRRVANLAARIANEEGADTFVVEAAALLHDIADEKFSGDPGAGPQAARDWLTANGGTHVAEQVATIIATMSFKGAGTTEADMGLEGRCVRDADRLEALGAIGIARTFAYGGSVGRPIHDPDVTPVLAQDAATYRTNVGTTVNHFHEKLLLLVDRMSTDTGRRLATERDRYMREFLERFDAEWRGES